MSIGFEARAAVLAELALGTAHTLNNALTAIAGEAAFLQSETKDPAVEDACGAILEQVERCARLTHALLRRRTPPAQGPAECELGRTLRDVEGLLRDVLPRRLTLAIAPAEESLVVALPAADAETLVLLLVQRATLRLTGAGHLDLSTLAGAADGPAGFALHASPAGSPHPAAGWHERLLHELLSARGGSVTFVAADGGEHARVVVPRVNEGRAATGSSTAGG
jgi:hypothetical protein